MKLDERQLLNPSSLAAPRGFTNGVYLPTSASGGVLFVAGQIGCDASGRLVSEGFPEQFDRALANVITVVRAADARPMDIGKLTIFVTDLTAYVDQRRAVGEVYRRHMGTYYPAMSLVEVKSLLEPGALVEIEALAVISIAPEP